MVLEILRRGHDVKGYMVVDGMEIISRHKLKSAAMKKLKSLQKKVTKKVMKKKATVKKKVKRKPKTEQFNLGLQLKSPIFENPKI